MNWLIEIEERETKATPGPWVPSCVQSKKWVQVEASSLDLVMNHDNDAMFVACARQDIPNLLTALTKMQEALDVTKQALLEIETARKNGPTWFTKGVIGQQSHIEIWLRKGFTAAQEALNFNPTKQKEVI